MTFTDFIAETIGVFVAILIAPFVAVYVTLKGGIDWVREEEDSKSKAFGAFLWIVFFIPLAIYTLAMSLYGLLCHKTCDEIEELGNKIYDKTFGKL